MGNSVQRTLGRPPCVIVHHRQYHGGVLVKQHVHVYSGCVHMYSGVHVYTWCAYMCVPMCVEA